MSTILRFAGRRILNNIVRPPVSIASSAVICRTGHIKSVPGTHEEIGLMQHDKHNKCLGRPMSPFLSVYKVQLTSLLSITHRLCGAGMAGGVYLVCVLSHFWPDYCTALTYLPLNPTTHQIMKLIIAYPFVYHMCNGFRHLSWDTGRFLELKQIYLTGYFMVLVVVSLLTCLAFM